MQFTKLPVYSFQGNIAVTNEQGYRQGYLDFPFEVPPGAGALRLRLDYSPRKVNGITNLITLGLFDPNGFRGNAHRQPPDREVVVGPGEATAGFLAGPIPAGQWLAQLALQAVVADSQPCQYSLDIELLPAEGMSTEANELLARPNPAPEPATAQVGPGWLRGELHSHTWHSDGSLSPAQLIALARQNQLDFLAITDHNTVSVLHEVEEEALDGLLLIPGMELTTFSGHALALGVRDWVDWRTGYQDWTMNAAARAVRAMGGLFIIAHPSAMGNPFCTGCRWEYPDFDLELADALEIWNEQWQSADNDNPKNLELWRELQSYSRRMPATAGTDLHGPHDWGSGAPRAYIYAESRTVPAILDGIRQGRVILSSGPMLHFRVSAGPGCQPAEIGDTLFLSDTRCIPQIDWQDAPPGAQIVLRSRQGVLLSQPVTERGCLAPQVTVQAEDRLWVELYDQKETLLAFTNPVFVEVRQS